MHVFLMQTQYVNYVFKCVFCSVECRQSAEEFAESSKEPYW